MIYFHMVKQEKMWLLIISLPNRSESNGIFSGLVLIQYSALFLIKSVCRCDVTKNCLDWFIYFYIWTEYLCICEHGFHISMQLY